MVVLLFWLTPKFNGNGKNARGEAKEKAAAVTSWEKRVAETSVVAEEVVRSGCHQDLFE